MGPKIEIDSSLLPWKISYIKFNFFSVAILYKMIEIDLYLISFWGLSFISHLIFTTFKFVIR